MTFWSELQVYLIWMVEEIFRFSCVCVCFRKCANNRDDIKQTLTIVDTWMCFVWENLWLLKRATDLMTLSSYGSPYRHVVIVSKTTTEKDSRIVWARENRNQNVNSKKGESNGLAFEYLCICVCVCWSFFH